MKDFKDVLGRNRLNKADISKLMSIRMGYFMLPEHMQSIGVEKNDQCETCNESIEVFLISLFVFRKFDIELRQLMQATYFVKKLCLLSFNGEHTIKFLYNIKIRHHKPYGSPLSI